MVATGETVGMAEWIIDDTSPVLSSLLLLRIRRVDLLKLLILIDKLKVTCNIKN